MPTRKIHNKSCEKFGILKETCDYTNRKMDEYSQKKPGCEHRERGHSLKDRNSIAKEFAKRTFLKCIIEGNNDCYVRAFFSYFDSLKASQDHIRLDKEISQKHNTCNNI